MKPALLAMLVTCSLFLSACACPRPEGTYGATPYGEEGTAGQGLIDNGCWRRSFD